jgi:Rrf2 family transcriptional regulator, repressor of oqxAB
MRPFPMPHLVGPGSFPVAVQALAFLARAEDRPCPSATIAEHVRSHAVYLRRVVAHLVRAGLVEAHEGREGGYQLARPADRITLDSVFLALKPSDSCDGGAAPARRGPSLDPGVSAAFSGVMAQAEEAALHVMRRYTIADMAAVVPVRMP